MKAPGVLVTVASPRNDSLMDPPCHMLLLSLPSRGQLPSCEMSIGMPFSRPTIPGCIFIYSFITSEQPLTYYRVFSPSFAPRPDTF